MSTPLLLEVVPEIDTNPTSFYRGRGKGSENEANLLLPLRTQKLNGFQLQVDFALPLDPARGSASSALAVTGPEVQQEPTFLCQPGSVLRRHACGMIACQFGVAGFVSTVATNC